MENNNENLLKIIEQYEKDLTYSKSGDIADRLDHCLSEFRRIARNAIYQTKNFADDVKIQFKALEIITEGLTDEGLNHGQKRTIANHIIRMLRSMVDKLDQADYTFNQNVFERFNFFRSQTPERRLLEERNELSRKAKDQEEYFKKLKEKHPDLFKDEQDEIPF
jgi:flagellin-specific chaperone FliS